MNLSAFPNFLFVKNSSNCHTLSGIHKNSHCSFFNVQNLFICRPSRNNSFIIAYFVELVNTFFKTFLKNFEALSAHRNNYIYIKLLRNVVPIQNYFLHTISISFRYRLSLTAILYYHSSPHLSTLFFLIFYFCAYFQCIHGMSSYFMYILH